MHSDQLLRRFTDPAWVGDLERPSVVVTEGNPTCGDVVQIGLEVADGLITEARFRTLGCAVAIAASDAICELTRGRTLTGAEVLDFDEVERALGGIPEERLSCATAPLSAFRSAIRQLRAQVK